MDLRNNNVSKLELSELVLNTENSLYLDTDLATKKMDTLTADTITINESGTLNIAGLNLISGSTDETTTITFTDSNDLISVLGYTGASSYTFDSISYKVSYNDGKFTFTKENKFTEETAKAGGTTSDLQATYAIDRAVRSGDFDKEIYSKLTDKGGDAVKDIKPTETQATSETTMGTSNMVNSVVGDRLESHVVDVEGRFSGKNAGDERMGGAVWGKVIYNHSKQDSSSHNNGFKSDSIGFVMGADAEVTDDLIVGLGYAYDRTDISSGDKDTDVKSHTVFAYGKYNFKKNWFVRGNAGYNFANYEEKVSYLGGKIADYDVNSILANADVGYAMENGFTPMAGVRYAYMDKDSYTDKAGQHVNSKSVQVLRGVVGVDYSKEVDTNGFKWTPKAGVGVSYDIKNTDSDVVVNVGSSSYRTDSERLKREALEARVGASTSYKNWDFSVDYELNLREKFQSHTGTVKAVYKF